MINSREAEKHTVQKIKDLMEQLRSPKKHVYESAGMDYRGFERVMNGEGSFTITQLAGIAQALNVQPADLLPKEWVTAAKAA